MPPDPQYLSTSWTSGGRVFTVTTACNCPNGDTACLRDCQVAHDAAVAAAQVSAPPDP